MSFDKKVILVTGGAGFIGSNLVEVILKDKVKKLIVLDNFVAGKKENIENFQNDRRFELIAGDIRDYGLVKKLVQKSDLIFNLAASKLVVSLEHPRVDLETNILGTFNILEAARKNPVVRIVHASTGSVLGSSHSPMAEEHCPNPTTLYGISKLAAEKYCLFYVKEFGVKVSVVRYFHVFGPRQDYTGSSGVVNIFLSRVLTGKSPVIFGTGEQIRCLTYVEDDIEATLMLANSDGAIGEIYNVASLTRISVKQLAEIIISKFGPKGMKPEYGASRQGENLRPIPDTTKIERLGFKAKVEFEEGLEKTKAWIQGDLNKRNVI
ncbi:MAG: GDP-mannose 4,6-dehydratase [Candidatus Omnitrophota bacterium]